MLAINKMKFLSRYGSRELAIESTLRGCWLIILAVGQIALFLYLHYPIACGGQSVSPKSLITSLESSSGRINDKFAYLRPTWSTVNDFLCHCADFDPYAQNTTDPILGPLVSLFKDQEFDIVELTDFLNKYDGLKRKPQRRTSVKPSTCVPWAHLEILARPPRIAMMTMATYSEKSTKRTDKKEDRVDEEKEEEGGEEEHEDDEEERLLFEEGQKASLADKEAYCRQHGYDFYAVSDAPPDRPVPWSKIPGALSLLSKKYDWLILVDVDAVIVDHSVKLEEFMDPRYDAILGLDENGINAGVFFLRNSVWSRLFLAEAWTLTEEPMSRIWWEQAAIMRMTKADGICNHVKLSPQSRSEGHR